MVASIFEGLHFCLDGFSLKQKQQLEQQIKIRGGCTEYLVTKQTSVLVIPQNKYSNVYKISQCTRAGVAVVTEDFIAACIDQARLNLDLLLPVNKDFLLKAIEKTKAAKITQEAPVTSKKFNSNNSSNSNNVNSKPKLSTIFGSKTVTSNYPHTTKSSSFPSSTSSSSILASAKPSSLSSNNNSNNSSTFNFSAATGPSKFGLNKKPSTTAVATSLNGGYSKSSITIKSSYFKEAGKYSSKKQKQQEDGGENELMMMGLFDDDNDEDGGDRQKPTIPSVVLSTTKPYFSSLVDSESDNTEEDTMDRMMSLFGDDDDDNDSAEVTAPSTQQILQTNTKTLYPFFEDTSSAESLSAINTSSTNSSSSSTESSSSSSSSTEPSPSSTESSVLLKARQLKRHQYLCKQSLPPPYSDSKVVDDDGKEYTLKSISGMKEYTGLSFEELRQQSMHGIQSAILSTPELAFNGNLWAWGWNKYGQLGIEALGNKRVAFPTYMPAWGEANVSIKQVAAGLKHTVCVTTDGKVLSWGKDKGLGRVGNTSIPAIISTLKDVRITYVACGAKHSAFVSDQGKLYTTGVGKYGQLGHGSFDSCTVPRMVESLAWDTVAVVSCGTNNTAAITNRGQLYTWGSNSNGQLGYKFSEDGNASPTLVPDLKYEIVLNIAVGNKHMAAVSSDGDIWTWGCNDYNQLGREGWNCSSPTKLEWSQTRSGAGRAIMVSCGESHTAVVVVDVNNKTKNGATTVLTWGRGDLGALGIPNPPISSKGPHVVKAFSSLKVTQISCGANHTAVITARGTLYLWGDNSQDQSVAGDEIRWSPAQVAELEHVSQISCGGYHSYALVSGESECIFQHSKDGHYYQVKDLLDSNPSLLNAIGYSGYGLLHIACQHEREKVVELLIQRGANVNGLIPHENRTPLHLCAAVGSVKCAEALVAVPNIDLNLLDFNSQTPLHRAVIANKYEMVATLVRSGSDKRCTDANGYTPLHFAVVNKHNSVARHLVRSAAPITIHDTNGKTPLDYCATSAFNSELKKIAQSHDVFISYAHADMQFARKVRMELERNCIKCWMDDQRLEAGRADIGNGILAARIIVFLGSPTSIVSDWCLKELRMGEKNSKIIWPVWYQKAEVPSSVSVLFSTSKYVDLSLEELYQPGIVHLVKKIKKTLEQLDRFEDITKSEPVATMDFSHLNGKPFAYMGYIPEDHGTATTLRYLLAMHGVICVDESMLPTSATSPTTVSDTAEEVEEKIEVDVNQGFWEETKKKEEALGLREAEDVVAQGNMGLSLCSAVIIIASKDLLTTKDVKIRKWLRFAEENHKPVVLIKTDLPQQFKFDSKDIIFGRLSKCPTFQFSVHELKFSNENVENLKRVAYVLELLYKESLLASKLRSIEEDRVKQLIEQQRLAEEEVKKRKKYVRL